MSNINGLPVGVVLDHSALVAYSMPMLSPGEVIREVWNDGHAVVIPDLCIAAAIAAGSDEFPILALLWEPGVQHVKHDFREVGRSARDFDGSLPMGAAALAARLYDAPVLTEYADLYRKVGLMAVPLD